MVHDGHHSFRNDVHGFARPPKRNAPNPKAIQISQDANISAMMSVGKDKGEKICQVGRRLLNLLGRVLPILLPRPCFMPARLEAGLQFS